MDIINSDFFSFISREYLRNLDVKDVGVPLEERGPFNLNGYFPEDKKLPGRYVSDVRYVWKCYPKYQEGMSVKKIVQLIMKEVVGTGNFEVHSINDHPSGYDIGYILLRDTKEKYPFVINANFVQQRLDVVIRTPKDWAEIKGYH